MKLQKQLTLEQARFKKVAVELTEEDPKLTLTVRTALTLEVAETFGVRELIYAGNVPRSGVKGMDIEGGEIDCEVHFQHDSLAFYAVAKSIDHYKASFEGTGPQLEFQIKLTGFAELIGDIAMKVKVDPLEIILKPAQMDLGLKHEGEEESEPEAEADDSERLISREQAADTAKADEDLAPLASVVEMGGSHQKGNKKKHGRRGAATETIIDAPPADEDEFMKELGIPEVVN